MEARIAVRTVVLIVGLTMANFAACAEPPPMPLFERVNIETARLSPKQDAILKRIRDARDTVGVQVVKFQGVSLQDAPATLTVPLQPGASVELTGYKITQGKNSTRIFWHNKSAEESATLSVVGDAVSGLIHADKRVYSIEPLGNRLHALVQVDQTVLTDEPPTETP